jgi:hypothetical protein
VVRLKHGSFRPARERVASRSRLMESRSTIRTRNWFAAFCFDFTPFSFRSAFDGTKASPSRLREGQLEIVLNVIAPEPPFLSTRKHPATGQFSTCSCVSGT